MATNHQQSSAMTLKEAKGEISLVSTFSVGIRNDQEMPEAPADCMSKGDPRFIYEAVESFNFWTFWWVEPAKMWFQKLFE